MRGAGHGEERAHAELFHVAPLEHLDVELELARELARLLGEVSRRADVRGQVAERAREVHAVGGRLRLGERLLELRARRQRQRHVCERRRRRLLLRLELIEAVERLAQTEHRLAQVPAERTAAHFHVDEEEGRVLRAELAQRVRRAAQRVAIRALGELLARAETDEQHALGRDLRQRAQQERGAGFAGEVGERLAQRAFRALVDAPRRRG